ncbi:glycosyltransferase family A protein [Myroides sp. WP-1]|uniref:glycosyltransferase family 2 protein n=1 Tax=Myroides sp. WP-1 TaxID=2759944 RepID=UPI0015F99ACA|nr:glycosyltransferase family A protein [Myroides sp. WP-1]MBB1139436.1 glycosyltransferase family 2 protein [Myroides sp. WP-1]
MTTPRVSIIIPVYNGAKFIERTLIALLNQSLNAIEIIVVDDGSTDHTLAVVNAMSDPRIRIISKENGGVSSARNTGIKAARGEYIGFVDADDTVKEDFYEQLLGSSSEVDVVISGLLIEKEGNFVHKESLLESNRIYSQKEFAEEVLARYLTVENLDLLSVVNKIYKRDFLMDKAILFDENLTLEEDGMFNLQVYTTMNALVQIAYSGYYYLENEASVTRDFMGSNALEQLVQKFNYDYKNAATLAFSEAQIRTFKSSRFMYSICFLLFRLSKSKMKRAEKNAFIDRIMQEPTVLYAAQHLNVYYVQHRSKFEKIIGWCIQNKRVLLIKGLVQMLSIAHRTKLIEMMRKIN